MSDHATATGAGAPPPRYRLLWLAALAVVAVQAMALATRYFQPWLDGDYLLVERFAADVLGGSQPLSGWTLSSSPYLFPDFALGIAWKALLGPAPLLPWYVVATWLALALLAGWSLQQVRSDGHGWLLGALLANLLLAFQGTADHARWLWWLGTANMHGGALLLGLALVALWLGPADTAPTRGRCAVATLLLALGLASDTLLLTQFAAPLAAALYLTASAPRLRSPRLRAFGLSFGLALTFVAGLRGSLALADWGNFPKVVRYAPTPPAVLRAAGRMLSDLAGPVAAAVPGFALVLAVAMGGALWLRRRSSPSAAGAQADWFVSLSLLATLLLPALAVYWQNPQHGRYLLPCLVLPLWWLAALLPLDRLRTPFVAGLVTASLLGLAWLRGREIDFGKWAWPYPDAVAALDRQLRPVEGGRLRGLAGYWQATRLNALSRHLQLTQIRPDGRVQFWGNNAFDHYETAGAGAPLRAPVYSFIIADDLDPAALRAKFGAPASVVTAGESEIWLYEPDGAARISALVDGEVRAFLADRPGTERIAR